MTNPTRRALDAAGAALAVAGVVVWLSAGGDPGPPTKGETSPESALHLVMVGLAGLAFAASAAPTVLEGWRTRWWDEVRGSVVESGGVTDHGRAAVWANPQVRYRYAVGDRTLAGSRIRYGYVAPHTASRYVPGRGVTVWYDPERPEDAVLDPGPCPLTVTKFFVAVAVSVGALIVAYRPLASLLA